MTEQPPPERPHGDPLVPREGDSADEDPDQPSEVKPTDLPPPGQHDLDDDGDQDIGAGAD